jgi:hypothetical protein
MNKGEMLTEPFELGDMLLLTAKITKLIELAKAEGAKQEREAYVDIAAAKEKELLSKISDLEILLDNCKVAESYTAECHAAERIEIVKATLMHVSNVMHRPDYHMTPSEIRYIDPATVLSGMERTK